MMDGMDTMDGGAIVGGECKIVPGTFNLLVQSRFLRMVVGPGPGVCFDGLIVGVEVGLD